MSSPVVADVSILGCGPVGLSLAQALAGSGLSVVMLDAAPNPQHPAGTSQPERSIALSLGSFRILHALGVPLPADQLSPIRSIQVSQEDMPGTVVLDSDLLHAEFLGQVLELPHLRAAIAQGLGQSTKLVQTGPVHALQQHLDSVSIHTDGQEFRARLLVGADGGHGNLLRLAGLNKIGWDHNKYACIASLNPVSVPHGVAYEHFLSAGPLAFLPFSQQRLSLVWSLTPREAAQVQTMNDADFLNALNRRLPPHASRIRGTGPRALLPLSFQRTLGNADRRLALIGNAAQTLHPVAGQGFNLGLRDAVALAEMIKTAHRRGEDFGSPVFLRRYAASRRWDRVQVVGFTEGLTRLFSNTFLPVKLARGLGLGALAMLPGLKRQLAARAAGLLLPASSHTPALTPPPGKSQPIIRKSGAAHGLE